MIWFLQYDANSRWTGRGYGEGHRLVDFVETKPSADPILHRSWWILLDEVYGLNQVMGCIVVNAEYRPTVAHDCLGTDLKWSVWKNGTDQNHSPTGSQIRKTELDRLGLSSRIYHRISAPRPERFHGI